MKFLSRFHHERPKNQPGIEYDPWGEIWRQDPKFRALNEEEVLQLPRGQEAVDWAKSALANLSGQGYPNAQVRFNNWTGRIFGRKKMPNSIDVIIKFPVGKYPEVIGEEFFYE